MTRDEELQRFTAATTLRYRAMLSGHTGKPVSISPEMAEEVATLLMIDLERPQPKKVA